MQKGFTLLETMVAISILMTAMGGPFVITQLGLRTARQASQELVASNLAQEAVEYIRYIRDTNAVSGVDWLNGIESGSGKDCVGPLSGSARTCVVDAVFGDGDSYQIFDYNEPLKGCTNEGEVFTCPPLLLNEETALYGYDEGAETIYHRGVHMQVTRELGGAPQEVRVVGEVVWRDLAGDRSVKIEEYITDWR